MWNPEGKLLEPKYRPIFSPRTSYLQLRASDQDLLADMTLNFDRFTINLLKKQFEARNGQITLIQFISIVNQHLKSWQSQLPNRQIRLIRCLTILFKEIDINGNGLMDWEEFTNYIIEKATVLKNLKTKSDEVKSYTRTNVKPKEKIQSAIQKCIYIEELNRIAMFEEGSNVVKFMNPDNGDFNPRSLAIDMKKLIVNISSVKKEKDGRLEIKKKDLVLKTDTRILDIVYIPDERYKLLVTSTSDGMVRGWRFNNGSWMLAYQPDNQEEVVEHHFNEEICSLAWDSINEIIYCGQNSGKICMWNLKTDTEKMLDPEQEQHSLMVTEIIPMPKLQFVASASMDSKIILWNTINYKVKSVYREHTRGIVTMTFNEALILLFSAGFDHLICIWNPYISTLIHKIHTHNSPIICMKITESNNQLISIDSDGIVKVSDTRRFNNISGFSVTSHDESQNFVPSSVCVIRKPLKLAIVGNSINIFQYDKLYNPNTADDVHSICCKFIQESLLFLTPAGNKVKVWNALNGDVNKIFLEICPSDISSFCLDHLKKRMIVGTYKGDTNIYNAANGAKLKQLPKHNSQVTHLLSYKIGQMELFFTAGIDGLIYIYKEMEDFHQLPRTISIKNMAITRMVFCPKTNLLIVGTNSGWVGFYDRETAKLIGGYTDQQEISGLELTSYQAILITNIRGKVTFINMPPCANRYQEGFSIRLYDHDPSTLQKLPKSSEIAMCAFNKEASILYTVDEKSFITAYRFNLEDDLVRTNLKNHRLESQRIQRAVTLLWMIRAHSQVVKSIEFVQSQKLLLTTAFDKKINIFSSVDGRYIDSLQQNYQKFEPSPVAYQRISTGQMLSDTMEPLFKKRPSIRTSTRYRINGKEPDPFIEYSTIKPLLQKPRSNPDWKLFIQAHKHYLSQEAQFYKIITQVKQSECMLIIHPSESKAEGLEETSLFKRKKQLDKIITQRKSLMTKVNEGFTSRSILIKKPLLKEEEMKTPLEQKLKIRLNKQQLKIFNMFKNQSKRTIVNNSTERQNQQRHADKLCKSKNVSTIRDDSMLKSQEEKNAIRRLNLALATIDNVAMTEKSFYKSSRNQRLPRII